MKKIIYIISTVTVLTLTMFFVFGEKTVHMEQTNLIYQFDNEIDRYEPLVSKSKAVEQIEFKELDSGEKMSLLRGERLTNKEIVEAAIKAESYYDIDNDLYILFDGLEIEDINSKCNDDKCYIQVAGVTSEKLDIVIRQLTFHLPWSKVSFATNHSDNELEVHLVIKEH